MEENVDVVAGDDQVAIEEKVEMTVLTKTHFLKRLEERVSGYNARLLLNAAIVDAGLDSTNESKMDTAQAKTLCLSLIKKGGPAFQVGQGVYKEFLQ